MKMNSKLVDLALQVGGSHYPEVSQAFLETTVRLVVKQCADAYHQTRSADMPIEKHFLKQFDLE